ncbi:hypothetical protein [Cohnella herbarum]|uniref:Uncharacterized protein n=1 Tax=Cohnella herbarum TaxID=2728023 RepID=A0A7Z2VFZ2_9BACL|nr:hypothetical protein [Cohnella herbarum]QJD82389.1 hypothetical protein HH215_03770 [Cohnella herbarum]
MKEDDDSSSVWSKYVAAKQSAFGPPAKANDGPNTIEELEAAIAEAAASSGIPEIGMPPRSEVHYPVRRRQLSKWFYLVLVILFTGLVVGLLWWGQSQQY